MAKLLQRINRQRRRPVSQRARIAARHGFGQSPPVARRLVAGASAHPVQRIRRPATGSRQQHAQVIELRRGSFVVGGLDGLEAFHALLAVTSRRFRFGALLRQPVQAFLEAGPAHGVRQTAAANGRQELFSRLRGQDKLHFAGRLFERLEQGVGGDVVHALGRKNQHHLGVATGACELREGNGFTRGIDLDFLAGLALFGVQVFLGFLVQRPAQGQRQRLGHQHAQIGVGVNVHRVAAAALAASALRGGRFTQPGAGQRQRQIKLPQTRRTAEQPGVAALGEQTFQLRLQPGGQRSAHVSQPLATNTACTSCHTAAWVWAALMRANRAGSPCWRRA